MAVEIIGAGFGRTGTLSMKAALEHLGFGPCHHMFEVFVRGDAADWADVVRGATPATDVDAALADLLDGFTSAVDFPSCVMWERLAAAHPDAIVLLTERPAADWWRSFSATIGPTIDGSQVHDDPAFASLTSAINETVFAGRAGDQATAVAAYEAHNARVKETVPPERLCVHEVGSGWGPLCAHLGVDPPHQPFPHSNTTEEFMSRRSG